MNTSRLATSVAVLILSAGSASAVAITHYVSVSNATPSAPYTNWATAAVSIQDAADVAEDGSTILVADGIYSNGTRRTPAPDGLLECRLVITNVLTVRSLNGPSHTRIVGSGATGGGNGTNAVRCVYMTTNAVLSGFTLTNGHTRVKSGPGAAEDDYRGGGACAPGALLTHCVIVGNSADQEGGGVAYAECQNCLIVHNEAGGNGGGHHAGSVLHCTVADNEAGAYGGGLYDTSATNSIVYNNTAFSLNLGNIGTSPGVAAHLYHVCTPGIAAPGCFGADPRFVDAGAGDYRLSPDSPCIGAGDVAFASGSADLDGAPRVRDGIVDMGAFQSLGVEYWLAVEPKQLALTTPYGISPSNAEVTVKNIGASPLDYYTTVSSPWISISPETGTSTGETDTLTLSFDTGGLDAGTHVGVFFVLAPDSSNRWVRVFVNLTVGLKTYFVDVNSATPVPPYTNWATAADTIQAAVDQARDGARVLVADGVYASGGRPYLNSIITNRVFITKDVTVESVNGAAHTSISGSEASGGGVGPDAVRAVFMSRGVLSGFTITNGYTASEVVNTYDRTGAGICTPSKNEPLIRDCIIMHNVASGAGGGAAYGTLERCVIAHNVAGIYGGGVYEGNARNCLIHHNSSGWSGGGTGYASVQNCTVAYNEASPTLGYGGGVYKGSASNSVVYYNTAAANPNWQGSYLAFRYLCTPEIVGPEEMQSITNEPAFVDSIAGDYQLASNSPCINAGNNAYAAGTTDLIGNDRIIDGTVDIGAYECVVQAPLSIPDRWWARYGLSVSNSPTDDLDGDGRDNYSEFVADTDPCDPASYFPPARIAPAGDNTRAVTVDPCSAIRIYDVLWKTDLPDSSPWQRLGESLQGTGGRLSIMVTDDGRPQAYYRTAVRLP